MAHITNGGLRIPLLWMVSFSHRFHGFTQMFVYYKNLRFLNLSELFSSLSVLKINLSVFIFCGF